VRAGHEFVAALAVFVGACSGAPAGQLVPDGGIDDGVSADGGACGQLMLPNLGFSGGIEFKNVPAGTIATDTLTVTNPLSCPTTLSPIVPQGNSASLFAVAIGSADFTRNYQYSTPIPPGGTVSFEVSFLAPQPCGFADILAYLTLTFTPGGYINVGLKGGCTN
jgi:hypothetical protein